MKLQWNKKYTTIAVYTAIVLLLSVLCVFFFLRFDAFKAAVSKIFRICSPIIYGAFIAYILNPLTRFFEEKIFRRQKGEGGLSRTARRALSVTATMLTFFVMLALFIWMIIPQLGESIKDLGNKLPDYIESLQEWATNLADGGGAFGNAIRTALDYLDDFLARSYDLLAEYLPKITSKIQSVASVLLDIVLGVIFAVYFLFVKERITAQAKKVAHSIFNERHYKSISETLTLADRTFGRYFTGAILDSILVGIVCFIMMQIMRMPYAPLISVVIGVTNIIPIFGPFLGAAPSAIILLVYKPILAVYFVIMILVLQQIDGNIIAPRIHGASTGLAPVWVILSITIMSGLFGAIGMFVGVPVFSVIYAIVKKKIEERLSKKQKAVETLAYMSDSDRKLYESKPDDGRTKKEKFLDFFGKFHKKEKRENPSKKKKK